jgi:hypothetical protein
VLDVATPEPLARRLTAGAVDALERLGRADLDAGRVNLIAIDAIAEAFGPRWSSKTSQVYDQIERVLGRVLPEDGYFVRVSPTDFLVVQPQAAKFTAQALCYRSFQEIWTHFLGKTPHPDGAIHRVTDVSPDSILAVELDPAQALAGEAEEAAIEARERSAELAASPLSPMKWTPFVASNGRRLDVACRLEPVFSVKTKAQMSIRLHRTVVDVDTREALRSEEIAILSRADLFRLDMATLSRGIEQLRVGSVEPAVSLTLPASYIALCHPPSRLAFTKALVELRALVRTGLIIEIHDLHGAPHSTLAPLLASLRPECLLVVGHLSQEPPPRSLKGVGLQAVSVSCPKGLDGDAAFIGWLRSWIRPARIISRSVLVYRCGTTRRMTLAGAAGATHCGGSPPGSRSTELANPHPGIPRLPAP